MLSQTYFQQIVNHLHLKKNGPVVWMGEPLPFPKPEKWAALEPEDQQQYYLRKIKDVLYTSFYVYGEARPTSEQDGNPGNGSLEASLSACQGKGYWAEGWVVLDQQSDRWTVTKGGLKLHCNAEEVRTAGDQVEVLMPAGSSNRSPGFYSYIGDAGNVEAETIVRLYFHATLHSAAPLARLVNETLNAAQLPYFFKILNDDQAYGRADAAVLYIDQTDYERVRSLLQGPLSELAAGLGHSTTAFTLPLAPGIGLAEDPNDGESFGEHCCSLIAQAAYTYYFEQSKTDFLTTILHTFREAGIDPARPYLQPRSTATYEPWQMAVKQQVFASESKAYKTTETKLTANPLSVSLQIGNLICERAVWTEDRCNWLRPAPKSQQLAVCAHSAEIYDGTSGIAWFLADLYEATGMHKFRQTALGAIRQALAKQEQATTQSYTFHQGLTGVLVAALQIAQICEAPELETTVRQYASALNEDLLSEAETDLIGGLAGSLIGLIHLAEQLPELNHFPGLIEQTAQTIVSRQSVDKRGISWVAAHQEQPNNLCGFSHGNSGIVVALLEAQRYLKTDRWMPTIEQAIQYEEAWHAEAGGQWADLRYLQEGMSLARATESVFWCHGAPGLALARKTLFDQLHEPHYQQQMLRDADRTFKYIEESPGYSLHDYTLCHGLGGALWVAQSCGLETTGTLHELAAQVEYVLEREDQPDQLLNLGYFTGLSGVGAALLAGHQQSAPGLLLPTAANVFGMVEEVVS